MTECEERWTRAKSFNFQKCKSNNDIFKYLSKIRIRYKQESEVSSMTLTVYERTEYKEKIGIYDDRGNVCVSSVYYYYYYYYYY
jgi:hypothetical protein